VAGIFDLIRNLAQSPADRRLRAAAQAAEVWQSAPRPGSSLAAPFSGGASGPPGRPTGIEWWNDQIPPSPERYRFTPGHSDHTYQNLSAPILFDGFDLERIRNACSLHRLGWFYETSALMVAILGFAPVMAAAAQAVAPILALPRHVHGGDKGLAKLVASEIEDAICPSHGLHSSPYFPPQLWGAMALYLRFMGFCVLQHVDGDVDPDTGVRPRFTRIWEPWAVQRWRVPRKVIAYTTEKPVEICNDGKFTLIEDTNEGHLFDAAILALGEETLAGKLTQEQRLRWQDFFSSPKLIATLPEKVPTQGEAGDAFAAGLEFIYGPDGRGIVPYGAKVDAVTYGSGASGAQQFQGTLLDAIIHIFMVLTGSAGTIGNGMNSGAGGVPYQPAKGGAWSVRHDLIRRPTLAIVRGVNAGHVAPYCDVNYGDAIARARKAGAWKDPVVTIPLPDQDRDERIASVVAREEAWGRIAAARRENGADFSQEQSDGLRDELELKPIPLLPQPKNAAPIYEWEIEQKVVAVDEARERKGLAALPDGQGSLQRLAEDRAKGIDKTGQTKVTEDEKPGGAEEGASADDEEGPPAQRNPPVGGDDGPKTQPSGRPAKEGEGS